MNTRAEDIFSERKVDVLYSEKDPTDETCVTFIFRQEDHTLGNALKNVVSKFAEVEFCGYNVPHPLEDKILLRVQTKKGYLAVESVKRGLKELDQIFETIKLKFQESNEQFSDDKK